MVYFVHYEKIVNYQRIVVKLYLLIEKIVVIIDGLDSSIIIDEF